ncbi:ABC transporter permease [Methanosalsum natronophilum]|uniref:ABC transporter permease n=1 Tax=Methanosalsum natronophilum TaxID=768733 RepID=A0A424YWF8_9EURY|nr:ABC transporter permease [Methanosalsum natronophilum]MCS3923253.1 putative ABC transport system permease protein [Methanosalsum natronophilum]RQD83854.1 MAG: ABC transporter permease [Methanosalsum natronophilum]
MDTYEISSFSLFLCLLLLLIPLLISYYIKLKLISKTLVTVARMSIQLFLVGIFLTFLFDLNNSYVNFSWILIMLVVAGYTSIKDINLKVRDLILPVAAAFFLGNVLVLLYFNHFVIRLDNLFEARYLIPIAGMFLGNSLRGNVVGLSDFFRSLKHDEMSYTNRLSFGAKKYEALMPYIRNSLLSSLQPTLASMVTIGIVTLPGMMTGLLLAGESPLLAVTYQLAIMIGIYVSTMLTVSLTLLMTIRFGFDRYGLVKQEIFSN